MVVTIVSSLAGKCSYFSKLFGGSWRSWHTYFTHEIRNAGIGLACLYMTVLAFDSITSGYAYSQGVSEGILGILSAVGAGMGLLGSIVFPSFVRFVGIERTGKPLHRYCL